MSEMKAVFDEAATRNRDDVSRRLTPAQESEQADDRLDLSLELDERTPEEAGYGHGV